MKGRIIRLCFLVAFGAALFIFGWLSAPQKPAEAAADCAQYNAGEKAIIVRCPGKYKIIPDYSLNLTVKEVDTGHATRRQKTFTYAYVTIE